MKDDTFSMAAYKTELDKTMANVMPDSWAGHTRLALAKMSDGLSEEEYQFAQRLATRLHGKADPETVARVSKKKTLEKLD